MSVSQQNNLQHMCNTKMMGKHSSSEPGVTRPMPKMLYQCWVGGMYILQYRRLQALAEGKIRSASSIVTNASQDCLAARLHA